MSRRNKREKGFPQKGSQKIGQFQGSHLNGAMGILGDPLLSHMGNSLEHHDLLLGKKVCLREYLKIIFGVLKR